MICELYEIRKQLDDLQRRLELYEKRDLDESQREHQELFDRIEKRRIYDKGSDKQKNEVEK